MASKRRLRRKMCNKIMFKDKTAAVAAMISISKRTGTPRNAMSTYVCPFCKKFHYGHVPQRPHRLAV